ncbi:hypothetical protein LWM68_14455 [Niabella sp. W65]|nr:hypothetical protein [Niabella sp. W65]MCH7363843.1 hypothetical protein [Niabella sp. W65]ULT39752.1 hypothetical protein KRR40_33305 [Niabella sp. I65]
MSGKGNDATMPLHLMKPDYDIPYGETTPEKVKVVLDRVYEYLNAVTPAGLVDKQTGAEVELAKADENAVLKKAISGSPAMSGELLIRECWRLQQLQATNAMRSIRSIG